MDAQQVSMLWGRKTLGQSHACAGTEASCGPDVEMPAAAPEPCVGDAPGVNYDESDPSLRRPLHTVRTGTCR